MDMTLYIYTLTFSKSIQHFKTSSITTPWRSLTLEPSHPEF